MNSRAAGPPGRDAAWKNRMQSRTTPEAAGPTHVVPVKVPPRTDLFPDCGAQTLVLREEALHIRPGHRLQSVQVKSKCFERGLKDDEFVLRGIAPEAEDVIDPSEWLHV